MKIINNKKGSALLWCILFTVILTILLGAMCTAAYAYFNYTVYTVKRQQAYFTARSAMNVILENLSSEEQVTASATGDVYDTLSDGTKRKLNFDGNYIYDKNKDGIEDIVNAKGEIVRDGKVIDSNGYLIEDYKDKHYTQKTFTVHLFGRDWDIPYYAYEETPVTKRVLLVKKKVTSTTGTYTASSSSNIALLPAEKTTLEITDFGFDSSLGTANATIYRSDDDVLSITVNASYPSDANGEKYTMKATVQRQPVYFGGIAIKNLVLNGTLTLGDNTDLYWNSTNTFKPTGNGVAKGTEGSITNSNPTNNKIYISGNLVTKGNATLTVGTHVAGKTFDEDFEFTSTGISRKIWNASEYIISNKTLLIGDTGTEYSTSVGSFGQRVTNTTPAYCNSRGLENVFGGYGDELIKNTALQDLMERLDLEDAYQGIADSNFKIKNSQNDATTIKYIEVLSLSNTLANRISELKNKGGLLTVFASQVVLDTYNKYTKNIIYDTLDVSYIEFTSTDESNRSDEVIPIVYLFVKGGQNSGLSVRVKYGCDPTNRTRLGKTIEDGITNIKNFISNAFSIDNKPSYTVVYLEENSVIELGWAGDGYAKRDNSNAAVNVFYYSIYGDATTKVIIWPGVTVVGEIVCGELEIKGDARVIYSSTNGSQVAKQKVAEFWTVSNYTD